MFALKDLVTRTQAIILGGFLIFKIKQNLFIILSLYLAYITYILAYKI